MKKKGFTLVELLAVIAILAILVIMALPAVLRMFNNARKDSFTNEVNTVIRTARQQYLLSGGQDTTWSNASGSTNTLDLTGNSHLQYYVKMNNEGKITKLQVSNGDFQYNVTNNAGIDVVDTKEIKSTSELQDYEILVIDGSGVFIPIKIKSCTYDGELVQDAEYVNGDYTYKYIESDDGWGVKLTTTNRVIQEENDEICTTINNKPIVSAENMFNNYQALKKINLSTFDTSHIKNMNYMFSFCYKLSDVDWEIINTSNVETMEGMFQYTGKKVNNFELDLSGFDMSKVTSIRSMFEYACQESSSCKINVSGWNTANISNMYSAFAHTASKSNTLELLGLSNWNTSNVTNMTLMFHGTANKAESFVLDLSRWDVSNVTNMGQFMQNAGSNAHHWGIGDLSNWDTSNVTNMTNMFLNAGANAEVWDSIGILNVYAQNIPQIFNNVASAKAIINLYNNPYGASAYKDAFTGSATQQGSQITVNYSSNVTYLTSIMNTKSADSNVLLGAQLD